VPTFSVAVRQSKPNRETANHDAVAAGKIAFRKIKTLFLPEKSLSRKRRRCSCRRNREAGAPNRVPANGDADSAGSSATPTNRDGVAEGSDRESAKRFDGPAGQFAKLSRQNPFRKMTTLLLPEKSRS
jgi:hypothetical protein